MKKIIFCCLALLGVCLCAAARADDRLSASTWAQMLVPPASGEKAEGDEKAPVTLVEYASLTCSHCAAFYTEVLPKIRETYIATGKVRLVFRGYALNPLDTAAQMLTHCAPPHAYFPLVGAFFTTQKSWLSAKDPVDALLQVSKQAGFTKESFETCLRNQKLLDDINDVRAKGEKDYGITGTPTFFINGERIKGEASFDVLAAKIEAYIK